MPYILPPKLLSPKGRRLYGNFRAVEGLSVADDPCSGYAGKVLDLEVVSSAEGRDVGSESSEHLPDHGLEAWGIVSTALYVVVRSNWKQSLVRVRKIHEVTSFRMQLWAGVMSSYQIFRPQYITGRCM